MNRWRLQTAAPIKALLFCFLVAVAPIGALAQTATIRVRVLDGRTGKNLSGMDLTFVDYHSDRNGNAHDDLNGRMDVKTSADGDSYVANPDAHGVLVFNVWGRDGYWKPCTRQRLYDSKMQTYGNEYLYQVSTVVATGLVSKNSCSKKTASPTPGELVIFIRPATWWEKFLMGMFS